MRRDHEYARILGVAAIVAACGACFGSGADPSTFASTSVHPVGIPPNITAIDSVVYDGDSFWGLVATNDGNGGASTAQIWRMPKNGAAATVLSGAVPSLESAVLFVDATRVYWIENSPAPTDTSCKLHGVPKTGGGGPVVLSNISDCGTSGAPGGLVVDGNDAWVAVAGEWMPPWNAVTQQVGSPAGAIYHIDLTKGPAVNATKTPTGPIKCAAKNCLASDATGIYFFERTAPDASGKTPYALQHLGKGDATKTQLATLPQNFGGGSIVVSGSDVWYTGYQGATSPPGSSISSSMQHVTTAGAGAATIAQVDGALYLDVDAAAGFAFTTRGSPYSGSDSNATVNNLLGDGVLRLDTKSKLGFTFFGPVELKPTRVVLDGDLVYLIAPHNIYGFDRSQFQ
jgi:hypothetical protein